MIDVIVFILYIGMELYNTQMAYNTCSDMPYSSTYISYLADLAYGFKKLKYNMIMLDVL